MCGWHSELCLQTAIHGSASGDRIVPVFNLVLPESPKTTDIQYLMIFILLLCTQRFLPDPLMVRDL